MTVVQNHPDIDYVKVITALAPNLVVIIAAASLYWNFWSTYSRRAEYTRYYGYPWAPNAIGFNFNAFLGVVALLGTIAFTWIHVTDSMNKLDLQRGETRFHCNDAFNCIFRKTDLNGFLFWLSASTGPSYVTVMLRHQVTPAAWSSWGRQLNLGFLSWGLHIATLGYREDIPQLWCYVILSQLMGLAWPLSLYFFARNLPRVPHLNTQQPATTPGESTNNIVDTSEKNSSSASFPASGWGFGRWASACHNWTSKPINWMPHQNILQIICTANLVVISCVNDVASEETSFYLVILSRFLSFLPLTLMYILPQRWGVTHPNRDSAMLVGNTLYRMIYISSLYLDCRRHISGFISGAFSGVKAALTHPRLAAAERRALRITDKLMGPTKSRTAIFLQHLRSNIPKNVRFERDILFAIDIEFAQTLLAAWVIAKASDVGNMILLRVPRRAMATAGAMLFGFALYTPENYGILLLRLGGSSALVFGADFYVGDT